jgi:Bacteriophage replication protein O
MTDDFTFRGFDSPAFTQTPDQFFDELAPKLTEAELRVLIYIMRRTFGFRKNADAISISQLTTGIPGFDIGTGMHRTSVLRGCKGLIEKSVITVAKVKSENGEYDTNVYALRFAPGVVAQSDYR